MMEMLETLNLISPYEVVKNKDKQHLVENIKNWLSLVTDLMEHHLFFILSEDSIDKLFLDDLVDKCGAKDFEDIFDGAWCIVYSLPTPGAMILFRAAESESRKYYERVVGKHPPDRWMDSVNDLRKNKNVSRQIVSYMDFLRSKRNEADHPGKRYTHNEAEEVLQHLSSMLNEMYP